MRIFFLPKYKDKTNESRPQHIIKMENIDKNPHQLNSSFSTTANKARGSRQCSAWWRRGRRRGWWRGRVGLVRVAAASLRPGWLSCTQRTQISVKWAIFSRKRDDSQRPGIVVTDRPALSLISVCSDRKIRPLRFLRTRKI